MNSSEWNILQWFKPYHAYAVGVDGKIHCYGMESIHNSIYWHPTRKRAYLITVYHQEAPIKTHRKEGAKND